MSDTKLIPRSGFHRSTIMVGSPVASPEGAVLGTIEDLLVDPSAGRVAAAVLSIPGGRSDLRKLVAVPFAAIQFDEMKGRFFLGIEPADLADAPSFLPEEWPELVARAWTADVYLFHGYVPYWE